MIDHRFALTQAAAAVDWPLNDAEQAELGEHLRACVACAYRAQAFLRDASGLRALPPIDSPARVRDALRWHPGTSPWRALLVAAALLLLALMVVALGAAGMRIFDSFPRPLTQYDWRAVDPGQGMPLPFTDAALAGDGSSWLGVAEGLTRLDPAGVWSRVDAADAFDFAVPTAIAFVDGRWIAVGTIEGSRAISWLSEDGRRWARIELPDGPDGRLTAVAGIGSVVVAVGTQTVFVEAPLVARSIDGGASWERADPAGDLDDLAEDVRLVSVRDTFLLAGCAPDCVDPGARWSIDGRTWAPGVLPMPSDARARGSIGDLVASDDIAALSFKDHPGVWTTVDGRVWTQVRPPGAAPPQLVGTPGAILALVPGGTDRVRVLAWRGTDWELISELRGEAIPTVGASAGGRVLLIDRQTPARAWLGATSAPPP